MRCYCTVKGATRRPRWRRRPSAHVSDLGVARASRTAKAADRAVVDRRSNGDRGGVGVLIAWSTYRREVRACVRAHVARFRAVLAARQASPAAPRASGGAVPASASSASLPARRDAARARRVSRRAEGRTDDADPLLAEAREIFERLGRAPWLERVERVVGGAAAIA